MTGSKNYLVRYGFRDSDVWRESLGNAAPLLAMASTGECLDAPDWIPCGSTKTLGRGKTFSVSGAAYCREYPNGY